MAGKVEEVERKIKDLEARLPKHSVPPKMIAELEELEEALENAKAEEAVDRKER